MASEFDLDARTRIADAVELTLAEAYPGRPPYLLCWQRAAMMHHVLSALSAQAWCLQAGSLVAVCADGLPGEPPYCVAWDFEAGLAEGRGFGECHAWVARPLRGNDAEIVDASTRHLPAYAQVLGNHWTKPVLPAAWHSARALAAMGYVYRPHPLAVDYFVRLMKTENLASRGDVAVLRARGQHVRVF